jgi:hypothetical protein
VTVKGRCAEVSKQTIIISAPDRKARISGPNLHVRRRAFSQRALSYSINYRVETCNAGLLSCEGTNGMNGTKVIMEGIVGGSCVSTCGAGATQTFHG